MHNVWRQVDVLPPQEATHVHQTRQRADSRGAPTKPKQEDAITLLVVSNQPHIKIEQVLRDTPAEAQLGEVVLLANAEIRPRPNV
jgi:hypothetical protein